MTKREIICTVPYALMEKKKTGMTKEAKCSNFQHSTLVCHASLDEHKLMINAPALRKDMKTIRNKGDSKKDRAMQIVFRSLHFLIKGNIALVKFKAMIDFLHSLDSRSAETEFGK